MDGKFLARPSGSIECKVHSTFQLEPNHGSFPEILVEGLPLMDQLARYMYLNMFPVLHEKDIRLIQYNNFNGRKKIILMGLLPTIRSQVV